MGKPGVAGVYTDQRLNLSKPWEGPLKKCQGFKPDPGNLAVRDFRGASRNVRHGETVAFAEEVDRYLRETYQLGAEYATALFWFKKERNTPAAIAKQILSMLRVGIED